MTEERLAGFRALGVFYAAFLAAVAFGQWLGKIPDISFTLWPPNGVYIGALLLIERRRWVSVVGIAAAAELTGNIIWFHNSLPVAMFYIGVNAVESLFCAVLLQRYFPHPARLKTTEQVMAIGVFGLCAAAVGATAAATYKWSAGERPFAVSWEHWWVGDGAGILLALPLTLVVAEIWRSSLRPSTDAVVEGIIIGGVIATLAYLTISSGSPVLFILLPPLLWAAVRFEFVGAVTGILFLAIVLGLLTVGGAGTFGLLGAGPRRTHVIMQFFLAMASVTTLVVAAIARQRREAMDALRMTNEELEARVAERTGQVQLLMREVNHRSKNLLMLVQVLARQTAASGAPDFQKRFERRLHSLAASQDLLVRSEWTAVPVRDLVMGQLAHLGRDLERRFTIDGVPLQLTAASAQTIGMALHELSTNAIKHGALSTEQGKVDVSWGTAAAPEGKTTFYMIWRETGGPPASEPERRGFGTVVIGDMVRLGLGGTVVKEFRPEGFVWTVEAPSENVLQPDAAERVASAALFAPRTQM